MSKYDYIYINYPTHAIPVFFNITASIKKTYFHWHGYDLIGAGIYTSIVHKYLGKRIRRVRHFVPSTHYKNILINKFHVDENNIFISPSGGVDVDLFKKDDSKTNKDKEVFVIGYASGLIANKGVAVLYEIMKKYKVLEQRCNIRIEFSIINYSEEAEKYIHNIQINELPVNIWSRMEKKEMVDFYSTIDLLLMPSPSESLGLVVLEAMSCSVPVITFNICSFPDFVISNISGERVDQSDEQEDNVNGFLDAIVLVKNNYNRYNPRDIVLKKYSQKMVVSNYKQVFNISEQI
jgi:glycosyltransferase involved in cell wall biosynthesis